MTQEELEKLVWNQGAKILVLRDVVTRLLAYEVARSDTPESVLQNFADGTNQQIFEAQKRLAKEPSATTLAFQEQIQAEIDWVVSAARKMAEGGSE